MAAPFSAHAAVFVRPLGGDAAAFPGELFVKRYGISPAECRVLMMLTQGMSPRDAAEAFPKRLRRKPGELDQGRAAPSEID